MPNDLKDDLIRINPDAQIWNFYSTAFFQAGTTHIRTEEAQRKITPSCGPQENVMSDCGWLHQQKSSS